MPRRRKSDEIEFTSRVRKPGKVRPSQAEAKRALEKVLEKTGYNRIKDRVVTEQKAAERAKWSVPETEK